MASRDYAMYRQTSDLCRLGIYSELVDAGFVGNASMETQRSIAERYRLEAARLRHQAKMLGSEDVRRQILNVAQGYEELAAIVEKLPPRRLR